MRINFSKILATVVLLAFVQMVQAQAFYTQDFAGGIPAGWTTTDGSTNTTKTLWEYCAGPSSNCVNLLGGPEFISTTADNGFMVLDSDGAGNLPSNHISRLTTAAINCSGKAQVFATFENYIGIYTVTSDVGVLLKVSTNGTTWTPYNVILGLGQNDFSDNPYIANIDISAVAANQATVFLQWEWTGKYEYWWFLDDVALTSVDPTPANDLTVSDFFYPVSSFETPVSQIGTDTFGFYGYVSNKGSADQNNVELKVEIFDADDNILFTDSVSIGTLEVGYVDSLLILPNQYVPQLPIGLYGIRYIVSDDSADAIPTDNVDGDFFRVSDFVFAKENAPNNASQPQGGGDYSIANLYRMSTESLENYKAVGFEFAAATNGAPAIPLEDISVTAYLFRVSDDVAPDFSNFDDSQFLSDDLELKAIQPFDFPTGAANGALALYPIELFDDNGDPGIDLEAGARYFATISYEGDNSTAFQANSDAFNYFFVSTVLFTDSWNVAGFGGDFNATIRMIIALSTSTDETPLPESAMTLFPNPVNDVLNLGVSFEQATDATITIADINGRVINIDNRKGLTNETLTYQVPQLAAGTYLARIATKVGTKTMKFVVAK